MKFTSQLVALAAATSAFAYTIPSKRADVDLTNIDLTNLLDGKTGVATSDACKNASKDYLECFIDTKDINKKSLDSVCQTYNSDKCQGFYKNGLTSIAACKNEDAFLVQMSNVMVQSNQSNIGIFCTKDEHGNYCPYGQFVIDLADKSDKISNDDAGKSYSQAINNTCRSKVCTESFVNFSDNMSKLNADMATLNNKLNNLTKRGEFNTTLTTGADKTLVDTVAYLKSSECSAQATSGASTTKATGFFVSAALIAAAYLL